ncbi:MAG TPA: hypothetical protein VGQ33_11565 [Vicinamibacteria bacterium]|nr:hypothetical protein [Vicinamibacteria bacterium]
MIIAAAVFTLMGAADPSPAFQSKAELQTWLTYYHREPRPELVVAALVALEDELPRHGSTLEAEAGRGGMRSFFGLVLAKSPDAVVQVEGHPFAPGTRRFVAEALWRCGTKACASALARWGVAAGPPAPDMRAAPVDSRSAIDDLWASYSATGDPAYVERVIAALPDSSDAVAPSSVAGAALRSLTASAMADPDVLDVCIASAAAAPPGRKAVLDDIVRRARLASTDETGS